MVPLVPIPSVPTRIITATHSRLPFPTSCSIPLPPTLRCSPSYCTQCTALCSSPLPGPPHPALCMHIPASSCHLPFYPSALLPTPCSLCSPLPFPILPLTCTMHTLSHRPLLPMCPLCLPPSCLALCMHYTFRSVLPLSPSVPPCRKHYARTVLLALASFTPFAYLLPALCALPVQALCGSLCRHSPPPLSHPHPTTCLIVPSSSSGLAILWSWAATPSRRLASTFHCASPHRSTCLGSLHHMSWGLCLLRPQ